MGIKKYNPTTPSLRQMTVSTFEEIDKVAPEKSLLRPLHSKAGRNANGRITVRHRGGGAKRKYRVIDFKRYKDGMKATVQSIEYDPNRSANIALLQYEDGEKTYILSLLSDSKPVMWLYPVKVQILSRVTQWKSKTSPSVHLYTMLSCIRARAVSSSAAQVTQRSSWRKKTVMHRLDFRPAKFVW